MAKTVVKPCNTPDDLRHPKGEHLSRVAYDDNEPPKNYIWCKPDGTFWKWNGSKWMPVMDFAEDCPHFPPMPPRPPKPPKPCPGGNDHGCDCNNGCITREQLTNRLELFKADLYAQLVEYLGASAGGGMDIATLQAYFEEFIEPRIAALEAQESSYDDTALVNSINRVDTRVTNVTNRVTNLENTRVTRDELNDALSGVATSSTITNITNRVTNLEQNSATKQELSDLEGSTASKQELQDTSDALSSALDNLSDRVSELENNPSVGGDFVTAEEVDDPSSIQL